MCSERSDQRLRRPGRGVPEPAGSGARLPGPSRGPGQLRPQPPGGAAHPSLAARASRARTDAHHARDAAEILGTRTEEIRQLLARPGAADEERRVQQDLEDAAFGSISGERMRSAPQLLVASPGDDAGLGSGGICASTSTLLDVFRLLTHSNPLGSLEVTNVTGQGDDSGQRLQVADDERRRHR
jgi:hypothetical protein